MLSHHDQQGADVAVHSLTKYIGGHGTTVGGAIVDSGRFDWVANKDRFPVMNTADPSYHDVVYIEAMGDAESSACHPASTTHRQLNEKELNSWRERRHVNDHFS